MSCPCRIQYRAEPDIYEIEYCPLHHAAPDLLEVARIEHELQMGGYTKATAKMLGKEAEEVYLIDGVPGLNNWRRQKREAAIAKAEGRS